MWKILGKEAIYIDIPETWKKGMLELTPEDEKGKLFKEILEASEVEYLFNPQTLEHTWEIANVDNDSSRVRLRKISRLNNVMSDETYSYDYVSGSWTRFDNIAGVGTQLTADSDLDAGGQKWETRTTTDEAGNILESVTTEMSLVGEFDNAVLRETYRSESTGMGWKWSRATLNQYLA